MYRVVFRRFKKYHYASLFAILMLLFIIQNFIDSDIKNNQVFVVVLTTEQRILTHGIHIWNTWGKENRYIVFACNCENIVKAKEFVKNRTQLPDELKQFEKAVLIPVMHLKSVNDSAANTTFTAISMTYRYYKRLLLEWYFMIDDDSFLFTSNLVKFIRTQNSSDTKVFGFKWTWGVEGGFVAGGPGILFTNESLSRLASAISNKTCTASDIGDISIGKCAHSVGITIGDSNDRYGRARIHPDNPQTHFNGPLPEPYRTHGSHSGKIGKECCSLDTISFHYVGSKQMYAMHSNKHYLRNLLG